MPSSFNRWFIRFGFRIGLGILVLIAFLYYAQKQNLHSSFAWVFHSSQVQQQLTNLARSIELSDSAEILENNLQNVQNLTLENPREQGRILLIRELLDKRRKTSRDQTLPEESRKIKVDSLNEQILTVIAEMRAEESRLLEEREKVSKQNINLIDLPIIIGGLFAFFLIYMANRITRLDVRELIRKDEELQKQAYTLRKSKEALELQTKILNLTMESMADGLLVINEKREFVQFNQEARKLLGFGPEDLQDVKTAFPRLMRDPKTRKGITAEEAPLMRSLKGESIRDMEIEVTPPSGVNRIISFSSRPIIDESGRMFGAIGVFHDVTAEKNLEERLRAAQKAAEETAQLKSTFLANMSHEIRTPMNGIVGMTELLKNTQLQEKQRAFVDLIDESCQSLLTIINDILDFSKIEAGKLEIEKTDFNLAYTVGRTVQLLAPQAHEKSLTLLSYVSPKIPSMVRGDSGRVGQVLVNLLSNALKFTDKGKVTVWTDLQQIKDDKIEVKFIVEDTGVGIESEKVRRLFQPFTQADTSTSRKYGGTGLGLSICKQLVELMGGQIGVKSTPGKGSQFWFTIPFEMPVTIESDRYIHKFPADCQILVYDEDPASAKILEDYIRTWDLEVHHLKNHTEFREALQNQKFLHDCDLMLVSVGLDFSHMEENFKFMQGLKQKPQIIVITDTDRPEYLEQFKKYDLYNFLVRPLDQSSLYNNMIRLLSEGESFIGLKLPAGQEHENSKKDGNGKAHRILLAEDNTVNQLIAQAFLKELGYSVQTVANGKEVLESLRQTDFDLVLMDCQMPEMDGFEATREVRAHISKRLPIVALTANAMKGDEEKCRQAGMNGYLSKPFRKEQLQAVLQKFLPRGSMNFDPSKLDMLKDYKDENDKDLRISLLETFFKTTAEAFSEMESLSRTDVQKFKRMAHTMKSTSAAVGGTVLASILELLEVEEFDDSTRFEKLRQARQEYENLRPILENYLKNLM